MALYLKLGHLSNSKSYYHFYLEVIVALLLVVVSVLDLRLVPAVQLLFLLSPIFAAFTSRIFRRGEHFAGEGELLRFFVRGAGGGLLPPLRVAVVDADLQIKLR